MGSVYRWETDFNTTCSQLCYEVQHKHLFLHCEIFIFFPVYTWLCKLCMCFLLILFLLFLTCWMSSCSEDRQDPDSWMWLKGPILLQLFLFHFSESQGRASLKMFRAFSFVQVFSNIYLNDLMQKWKGKERKISLAYASSLELHSKQKYFVFYFESLLFLHPSQVEIGKNMYENT